MVASLTAEMLGRARNDEEIGAVDFPFVLEFLNQVRDFYYCNFTFRATFDCYFKGGVRNRLLIPDYEEMLAPHIGESKELAVCEAFAWVAGKLAEKFCVVFAKKKRPYEMLALLLFNHYYSLKGEHFCDIGGASSPEVILNLFGALSHTIIESPDYVDVHGDIFARHGFDGNIFKEKLVSIKCNLEDLVFKPDMPKISRIFSMNCFEHIMELDKALQNLYRISSGQSYVYTTFYPIYSYFHNGHHGSISLEYAEKYPGIHHYSVDEQRAAIRDIHPGYTESEIMKELSSFHFNDIELINRLSYEDYRVMFYNSEFNFISCQEINTVLFQTWPAARTAYVKMAVKRTAFPEVVGIRAVLKKGTVSKLDALITNSLLANAIC